MNAYCSDHVSGSAGVHDRPMYAMGRSSRADLVGLLMWGLVESDVEG